jgi:hypothetical protein
MNMCGDMPGNVLNNKGMYNRCRLTKLVVDQELEQKVWEESWAKRTVAEGDGTEVERSKSKRGDREPGSRKRANMDTGDGEVWGEKLSSPPDTSSHEFLHGESVQVRRVTGQSTIKVVTGL